MKATASIYLEDGTELFFPELALADIAHELIKIARPELEMTLTDERRKQFVKSAEEAYIKDVNKWGNKFDYIALWVEKETEKYFAVERSKNAYNEMVIAYSKQVERLVKSQADAKS